MVRKFTVKLQRPFYTKGALQIHITSEDKAIDYVETKPEAVSELIAFMLPRYSIYIGAKYVDEHLTLDIGDERAGAW